MKIFPKLYAKMYPFSMRARHLLRLKDINLELMNNQMITVVGASGAGNNTNKCNSWNYTTYSREHKRIRVLLLRVNTTCWQNVGLVSHDYGR